MDGWISCSGTVSGSVYSFDSRRSRVLLSVSVSVVLCSACRLLSVLLLVPLCVSFPLTFYHLMVSQHAPVLCGSRMHCSLLQSIGQ